MGGDLNEVISDLPYDLIGSLFGLWFLAWIIGLISAHYLRIIFDVLNRSVDD